MCVYRFSPQTQLRRWEYSDQSSSCRLRNITYPLNGEVHNFTYMLALRNEPYQRVESGGEYLKKDGRKQSGFLIPFLKDSRSQVRDIVIFHQDTAQANKVYEDLEKAFFEKILRFDCTHINGTIMIPQTMMRFLTSSNRNYHC